MSALKRQGFSRDDLPYKAPFQPWGNYFALVSTAIITFFKGKGFPDNLCKQFKFRDLYG